MEQQVGSLYQTDRAAFNSARASQAKLEKQKLDRAKKKLYEVFLRSWDTKYGEMTPRRFYAGISFLKEERDIDACREFYKWCQKQQIPFAPAFRKKFMLK